MNTASVATTPRTPNAEFGKRVVEHTDWDWDDSPCAIPLASCRADGRMRAVDCRANSRHSYC
jgi:hypothetical protein